MSLYYRLVWVREFFTRLLQSLLIGGIICGVLTAILISSGLLLLAIIIDIITALICIFICIALANKGVYDERRKNGETSHEIEGVRDGKRFWEKGKHIK